MNYFKIILSTSKFPFSCIFCSHISVYSLLGIAVLYSVLAPLNKNSSDKWQRIISWGVFYCCWHKDCREDGGGDFAKVLDESLQREGHRLQQKELQFDRRKKYPSWWWTRRGKSHEDSPWTSGVVQTWFRSWATC